MKLKLKGILALFLVLITQLTFAQDRTVSGVVSDASGLPIPTANVKVKGTTNGVQTDFDGKYKIKANASDVLVFSYVGMKAQEVKATSTTINVKLASDANELNQVVVTAMGIKREKKSLGYATQTVSSEDLNRPNAANFTSNLAGKVSGLQIKAGSNFGGSVDVVLRGYRSITGDNQALFVVDGVPMINNNNNTADQRLSGRPGYDFGNTISDINPNDIAEVNVLKGAAATALYGSRAQNGAIIITTKRGKKTNDLGIEFSSSIATATIDKTTFAEYQDKYGQGYGYYYGAAANAQFSNYNPTTGAVDDSVNDQLMAPTTEDGSYGAPFNPNLNVWQYTSFIPESANYGKATPWINAKNGPVTFFQTGYALTNNLSFSKANDVSSFRLSYMNSNTTDVLPNSSLKKNSFTGNASYKLSDKLTANFYGTYVVQNTLGRNSTGYNGNIMSNFRQWWATNVDIQEQRDLYNATGKNYTWNIQSPTDLRPAYWDNPYFQRYENYATDDRNRFAGNGSLNYEFNKHFNITLRVGTDGYSQRMEDRKAVSSNPELMGFGLTSIAQPSGYAVMNIKAQETNYDILASYKTDLSTNVNLSAVVGGNINTLYRYTNSQSTSGGLFIPNLYTISNSASSPALPSITETTKTIRGIFAQTNIGFYNTYYLDGTIRRDESSALPKGNNDYIYYSGSVSAIISNWSFLKEFKPLNFAKVRASYAEVGSDTGANQLQNQYFTETAVNSPLYYYNTTAKNANLKPQRSKQTEFGINLQFMKNRFGLDFAWFKNDAFDQILNLPVSFATGSLNQVKNVGNLSTTGLEVSLNLNPINTENFKWDINVNWSNPVTKVTELAPGVENITLGSFQGGVSINASVNELYGTIKGTDFIYTNGQRTVGANGRYLITSSTNNVIGNMQAKWFGGLINKFTYKNMSLGVQVDWREGGSVFSLDQYYGLATGLYPETAVNNDLGNPIRNSLATGGGVILPGVYANGTVNSTRVSGTNYGLYGYRYAPASNFVYDASFVKLREVSFTYAFPSKSLAKSIKGLSMSIIGNNLWIIHKNLPYADPEAGLSSGNVQGYQSGVMPSTRNVSFNVKINL
ncbi:putative outer membrane protein, Omp121 family [Flavobacterium branchiophilum]|uniref:Probable outer membrane protein, Omp121 family n=1 Tax=Flavobacterium branchiophilum (strain FL-15) TaxID=1034807 RepID=G2Z4A4_FLABF|nr:SusC/RagA family TonB-linked outer membrane protein [Flavobacterium branchiophilum]CCB70595.1 Probable outer membrane protein precursor, Omp121 family [Flavobacterium branchiophilum FL-15]